MMAELLLGSPLFPGESGVDQLVEIIKVSWPARDWHDATGCGRVVDCISHNAWAQRLVQPGSLLQCLTRLGSAPALPGRCWARPRGRRSTP